MKKHYGCFAIAALTCLLFTALPAQKATGAIPDTVSFSLLNDTLANICWGKAPQGEKIVYYFRLKNNAGDSLVINKITTGDGGCYAEKENGDPISSVHLQKDNVFVFRITQSTKGKSGRLMHPVTVYYTDAAGKQHARTFRFYGTVF